MEQYNQKILSALTQYLLENPDIRFGQALMNVGINKFANIANPASEKFQLHDIYNESNEQIYERIKQSLLKNKT